MSNQERDTEIQKNVTNGAVGQSGNRERSTSIKSNQGRDERGKEGSALFKDDKDDSVPYKKGIVISNEPIFANDHYT